MAGDAKLLCAGGESVLVGPELLQKITNKVKMIQERM